jgi:hypothetical protein
MPKFDKEFRNLNIRHKTGEICTAFVPNFKLPRYGAHTQKKRSTYTTNCPYNVPCILSTNGLPFTYWPTVKWETWHLINHYHQQQNKTPSSTCAFTFPLVSWTKAIYEAPFSIQSRNIYRICNSELTCSIIQIKFKFEGQLNLSWNQWKSNRSQTNRGGTISEPHLATLHAN